MREAQAAWADGGVGTSRRPDERTSGELQLEPGRAIVALRGELDIATAPAAEELLREAALHAPRVILDLRRLSFMDCSGLRVVLDADAGLRRRGSGRRLVVVGGGGQVRRLFALTGMAAHLSLVDDLDAPAARPPATPGDSGDGGLSQPIVAQLDTPADVEALEAAVFQALDQGRAQVAIDLESAPDMSNAVLSSLCGALRRLSRRQNAISVLNPGPRTQRVLELCALHGVKLGAARAPGAGRVGGAAHP